MKKTRTQYAILNSTVSGMIFALKVAVQFVGRSVFIYYLGQEYLGINGLFSSILSVLSLAELGIGQSIIYSLYMPLANGDHSKVKALMILFKKIYTLIGFAVALIGIFLLPFLHIFINGGENIENIRIIYLLFLANSVGSYFFTYNRSLLNADQKNYITVIVDFVFSTLGAIIQILVLVIWKNYLLYLLITIFSTLLGNIALSIFVSKTYSFLKNVPIKKLDNETIDILKKNTIGNLASKIGSTFVTSTDNLLISSFISLSAVGLYSNYILIISSIINFSTQLIASVTGSIGQLAASDDRKKGHDTFLKHNFINFSVLFFITCILFAALNPFIRIWVGETYTFSTLIVTIIIINYVLKSYRLSGWVFIDAYGLAWKLKWKPLIESVVNLMTSLIFLTVFDLGITGILVATSLSSLLVVSWWEPYAVYKYGFNIPFIYFIKLTMKYFLVLVLASISIIWMSGVFFIEGWLDVFVKGSVGFVIGLVFYIIFFFKTSEFQYVLSLIKRTLNFKSTE